MRDPALDPRRSMLVRALWGAIAFLLFAAGCLATAVWSGPGSWIGGAVAFVGVGLAIFSVAASTQTIVESSRRLVDVLAED
jgi:hypothetical protein